MWKLFVLTLGTIGLLYVSRASLQNKGSHGFYRFFAWECILLLFLLNVEHWFKNLFAWYQLIAWIFLFGSLIPLFYGVSTLRKQGQPTDERPGNPNLYDFEKTTKLVTTGIYAYIRHPLYSSLLLLTWGIFFKNPALPGGALALVATTFLFATAISDERECVQFFGAAYQEYMKKTKRFIPYLF